jgi:ferredoxin-NADP reductase
MWDVIQRALRHPLDYAPVIARRTLILQEIIQESEEIFSFIFKPTHPVRWKAGQHGIFMFPFGSGKKLTGKFWRAFSIASSSHEGVIRISTIIKENPSEFKRQLFALQRGDPIVMHGPFGEFHTSKHICRIVGIAGGIGITPFRALLKDIASGVIAETQLTLIYSAVGTYTFKDEIETLAQHPSIEVIYTQTPEEVNAQIDAQVQLHGNSASYFISGSPGMINAIRSKLRESGIRRIINDSFRGY